MYKTIEKKFDTPGGAETDVITTFWCDKKGRRWKTVDARNYATITEFDNLDRVKSVTDALNNKVEYGYDANDNPLTITETEYPGPTTYVTTNIFDNLDRLSTSTDNLNNVTEYKYDSRNNHKYNEDRENHVIRMNYDGLNRLYEMIYELTPTGTITVKYGKDKNGRLVNLIDDNNHTTQYEYDAVNRRKKEILPDSSQKNYTFGQYGELFTITDQNGNLINHTYDNALRLTQKDITRGTGVEGTTQEVFTYNGLSQLTQATNYDGVTQISQVIMSYDSLGNLLQEQQQIGTQSVKSVASVYDVMSFRTSLSYPSGTKTINFEPDDLNRIERITQNVQLIAEYTYAGPGRVTGRSYYNGTNLSVTYDGGRSAITYTHSGNIGGFEYAFDNEDNKKYEKRTFGSKGDAFKYDAIYRLTGVKYGIPNTDLNPSTPYENYLTYDSKEEFELDGVGNRIEVTNGITTTYTTNNLNQYTQISTTNLSYDLNGNLTDDGINTYTYDYANRLLRVTRDSQILGEYKYDTLRRRISKTTNNDPQTTTYYYYDGVRCIEERNSEDGVIATYVFGNGIDEVLTMERNSETYYFHENSLGSIYAVTTGTGTIAERYTYDAYGNPIFLDGSGTPITNSLIANRLLFTGREFDTETGLYYYRARYYSAELGRFLQRDPEEADDLFSLYAYCLNNPINRTDPTGLFYVQDHDAITREAIKDFGYNSYTIAALSNANSLSDVLDADKLERHAIAGPGEDDDVGKKKAIAAAKASIDSDLTLAMETLEKCNVKGAIWHLGRALHTTQDIIKHAWVTLKNHTGGYDEPTRQEIAQAENNTIMTLNDFEWLVKEANLGKKLEKMKKAYGLIKCGGLFQIIGSKLINAGGRVAEVLDKTVKKGWETITGKGGKPKSHPRPKIEP
jgi:RHS repeat-associated protein